MQTQYWIKDQLGTEERIQNILSGQKKNTPQKEKSRHSVMKGQKTKTHKTSSGMQYFTTLF